MRREARWDEVKQYDPSQIPLRRAPSTWKVGPLHDSRLLSFHRHNFWRRFTRSDYPGPLEKYLSDFERQTHFLGNMKTWVKKTSRNANTSHQNTQNLLADGRSTQVEHFAIRILLAGGGTTTVERNAIRILLAGGRRSKCHQNTISERKDRWPPRLGLTVEVPFWPPCFY